jgi:hypothetical protein
MPGYRTRKCGVSHDIVVVHGGTIGTSGENYKGPR